MVPLNPLSLKPKIEKIARDIATRLPIHIEMDDLVSVGWVGALDACRRFEAGRGANAETFCGRRALGAMQDFLRDEDPLSRDHRRDVKAGIATAPKILYLDSGNAREIKDLREKDPATSLTAHELLSRLDHRSRRIVKAYFFEDRPMKEVGLREGVNESRVCQIIKESLGRMRGIFDGEVVDQAA